MRYAMRYAVVVMQKERLLLVVVGCTSKKLCLYCRRKINMFEFCFRAKDRRQDPSCAAAIMMLFTSLFFVLAVPALSQITIRYHTSQLLILPSVASITR